MEDLFFLELKCARTHSTFYARYDMGADDRWVKTYAVKNLPVGTGNLSKKNVNRDISNARWGPQYKCPDCDNKSYVRCSQCGKLTCYSEGLFTCAYCGHTGDVSGTLNEVTSTKGGRGQ